MSDMTVADLRNELAGLPDDMPVVLATSPEGERCAPLVTAAESLYAPGGPYVGEFYPTPEMDALVPFDRGPAPDSAIPALTLWPAS